MAGGTRPADFLTVLQNGRRGGHRPARQGDPVTPASKTGEAGLLKHATGLPGIRGFHTFLANVSGLLRFLACRSRSASPGPIRWHHMARGMRACITISISS